MKRIILFSLFSLLLTGCVHTGVSVDYRTQTLQLMSESGPTFIHVAGNSQFQKYKYNKYHITDVYMTNTRHKTAIGIIEGAKQFSVEGFFNGLKKDGCTIISKNNYSGSGMSPVVSMTIYDQCKLRRYAIFRFAQDKMFLVASQLDMQQSNYPCKKWMNKSDFTKEQLVITSDFEKTVDQSLQVSFQ